MDGWEMFLFLGNGIFKSTDGGLSWDSLPVTTSNTPQELMTQILILFGI